MAMFINLVMGTIPQSVHISNHHVIHFKYMIILCIQKVKRNNVNNNNEKGGEKYRMYREIAEDSKEMYMAIVECGSLLL